MNESWCDWNASQVTVLRQSKVLSVAFVIVVQAEISNLQRTDLIWALN